MQPETPGYVPHKPDCERTDRSFDPSCPGCQEGERIARGERPTEQQTGTGFGVTVHPCGSPGVCEFCGKGTSGEASVKVQKKMANGGGSPWWAVVVHWSCLNIAGLEGAKQLGRQVKER